MTDDRERDDRHPTDEPDGTPAYAASLRAPGESVGADATDGVDDETDPTDLGTPGGDTEMYRPD